MADDNAGSRDDKKKKGALWIVFGAAIGAFGYLIDPSLFGMEEEEETQTTTNATVDAGTESPAFIPFAPASYRIDHSDSIPSATLRLSLVSSEAAPLFCWFPENAAREPLSELQCEQGLGSGSLISTSDTVAGAFISDAGVRLWDGTTLVGNEPKYAFLRSSESGMAIDQENRLGHIGAAPDASIQLEEPFFGIWDDVFSEREGSLVRVSTNPEQVIGELPESVLSYHACRTPSNLMVLALGPLVHSLRQSAVTFRQTSTWSRMVPVEFKIPQPSIACLGPEMVMSWLEVSDVTEQEMAFHQIRCTTDGCEPFEAQLQINGTDPMVNALYNKTILMHASDQGTRVVVSDLADPNGGVTEELHPPDWQVLSRHLFVRRGVAAAIIRTNDGLYAFRIDRGGEVTQLERSAPTSGTL